MVSKARNGDRTWWRRWKLAVKISGPRDGVKNRRRIAPGGGGKDRLQQTAPSSHLPRNVITATRILRRNFPAHSLTSSSFSPRHHSCGIKPSPSDVISLLWHYPFPLLRDVITPSNVPSSPPHTSPHFPSELLN